MLLRFAVENILSFRDAAEFNTFPSSKSHSHDWHKVKCDYVTALRLSAIYGANGAGKSNLLRCITLLKSMVMADKLGDVDMPEHLPFKFNGRGAQEPSEMAVEFFENGNIFYYHIVFTKTEIKEEELLLSQKSKDLAIFSRKGKDISINGDFLQGGGGPDLVGAFVNAMNRVIRPDMLALSFFGRYYQQELPMVAEAYGWIERLQIVLPSMRIGFLPHVLDTDAEFASLINKIMPDLNTGIVRLESRVETLNEDDYKGNASWSKAIASAKDAPGQPQLLAGASNNDYVNVIYDDGKVYAKRLVTIHKNGRQEDVEMDVASESDGTRRLMEYMPLLYSILKGGSVFVVDEIERSVHPIMIKILISKISESKEVKGQIIFTTHESWLLDQDIFRPDEIWLAQKDVNQSTQLYPLSDYNIHKTANIENGYLNGRYGGIPFLSNLKDLKWL